MKHEIEKHTHLTEEFLKYSYACKEGIEFARKNMLIGMPLNIIDSIEGDFCGYKVWMQRLFRDLDQGDEPRKRREGCPKKPPVLFYDDNKRVAREEHRTYTVYNTYGDNDLLVKTESYRNHDNTAKDLNMFQHHDNGIVKTELNYRYLSDGSLASQIKTTFNMRGSMVRYEDMKTHLLIVWDYYYRDDGKLWCVHKIGTNQKMTIPEF